MGRVRFEAQSVEYQNTQAFQARPTLTRDLADIGAISDIADPEPQHVKMSVDERDRRHLLAEDVKRLRTDALKGQLGDHAGRKRIGFRAEGVGKDGANLVLDFGRAV